MDTEMHMSVSSMETLSQRKALTTSAEKNIIKACSTEDVKTDYGMSKSESVVKSHSEGSSRHVSLENFSDEFDGKRDKKWRSKEHNYENTISNSDSVNSEEKGSSVNVSVITSTPIKYALRRDSADNVVVITGNVKIMLLFCIMYI